MHAFSTGWFITSIVVQTVAFHEGHADGPTGRVALVLALQIALPCEQFPLFVQVLLPFPPISFYPPPVATASFSTNPFLPRPAALPGFNVFWVLPAEHCQPIHTIVGNVVSQELRQTGRHDPHATAFVALSNKRRNDTSVVVGQNETEDELSFKDKSMMLPSSG